MTVKDALPNTDQVEQIGGSMDNTKFFMLLLALLVLAYIIRSSLGS